MTASTLSLMFSLLIADPFYEEILHKYLSDRNEREEFKQELHLTICEMPKALEYWNGGCFKWVYISIVKRSICSSNSPYHYKYRKKKYELYEDIESFQLEDVNISDDSIELEQIELLKKQKINQINMIIQEQIKLNPLLKKEFTLFKMYFMEGMTYRAIAKKTRIPLMSCHSNVMRAKEIIINQINNKL